MPYSTQRFLSTRGLPSGRRLRVLRQLATSGELLAALPAHAGVADRLATATAATERERQVAKTWAVQSRTPRSEAKKGGAYKLDPALDRMVSAFQRALDARLALVPEESPVATRAAALLADAFPFGVRHITQRVYEEQIALVFELLATLSDETHAEAIAEAGLTASVGELRTLARAFDAALGAEHAERLSYTAVTEAARAGNEAYADVLVALLFATSGEVGRGLRERALAAHQRQTADLTIVRARGVVAEDIDPDTGEPEPVTEPAVGDEPAAPLVA